MFAEHVGDEARHPQGSPTRRALHVRRYGPTADLGDGLGDLDGPGTRVDLPDQEADHLGETQSQDTGEINHRPVLDRRCGGETVELVGDRNRMSERGRRGNLIPLQGVGPISSASTAALKIARSTP